MFDRDFDNSTEEREIEEKELKIKKTILEFRKEYDRKFPRDLFDKSDEFGRELLSSVFNTVVRLEALAWNLKSNDKLGHFNSFNKVQDIHSKIRTLWKNNNKGNNLGELIPDNITTVFYRNIDRKCLDRMCYDDIHVKFKEVIGEISDISINSIRGNMPQFRVNILLKDSPKKQYAIIHFTLNNGVYNLTDIIDHHEKDPKSTKECKFEDIIRMFSQAK